MVIELALIIITLIWLLIASVTDLKTREVPDWISYSLISIGIFAKLILTITENNYSILIQSLLGFLLFFSVAIGLYYSKQWGGGDAKLLMGLGIIFPVYPATLLQFFNPIINIPFLAIIMLNLLITGAIIGSLYSIYQIIKNSSIIKLGFNKDKIKRIRIYLILALLIFIISFLLPSNNRLILLLTALLIAILPIVIIGLKAVEKHAMTKVMPLSKLTEGEWVVKDIYNKGKLIYSKKTPTISNEQIKMLKKYNIKNVTVKIGIPFIPAFLIAIIISLIYGSPIFFI